MGRPAVMHCWDARRERRNYVEEPKTADGAGPDEAVLDVVDGCGHIEQLTVRPDHQGMGLGRPLVGHVRAWAADAGLVAITLTTFAG